MLIKIFIGLLAVSVGIMVFFTYYSLSWLGSIGAPSAAAAGYDYHVGISWPLLWLSTIILLLLANSILWLVGKVWPMWVTLFYFQIFIVIRGFWLDPAFLEFRNSAGLDSGTFTIAPILAALLIVISAAIVFFEQFLLIRLKAKTFPEAEVASEPESDDA